VLPVDRSHPAVTRANRSFSVSLVDPTTASSSPASRKSSVPALENPGAGTIADRRAVGLLLPKNRSSGNLVSNARADVQSQRGRMSVDGGVDYDMTRCVYVVGARIGEQARGVFHEPLCEANTPASGLRMTAGTWPA
jgi:hypothetical protein